jgi:TonB-dependent starch-binding outer membrane protein SusC
MSLLLLFIGGISAFAQRTITGTVTDSANGRPLQSVSVIIKGTRAGTQTSADGKFTLSAPANARTLVISSVGYGSKEVAVSENLNISLSASNASLNEVVVIGYGTTRKKDLTGSIATVGQKDFQKGTITTPEQLISGKIPGVQITSNGGQPGSGSVIRIRGLSSLSSNSEPLVVIDGVPLERSRKSDGSSSISGSADPLSLINPNDIETFTVLKDASAAAIYGSRASGGVILITTKKGRGGKLNVSFNTVNSESVKTKTVDVLSPAAFTNLVNEMGTDNQKALLGNSNTNWQNEIYHPAFSTDNNISVSGGIKQLPYRLSFGYLDQDGILKTDNLKRTSGALSLTPSLFTDHLKISLNVKGTIEKFFFANQGAIGSAVFFDPTQPVYDSSSKYGGYYEWLDASGNPNSLAPKNPLGILMQNNNTSNVKRSIGNIVFDYKFHFLPDLHANLNLGYDVSHGEGGQTIPVTAGSVAVQGGFQSAYEQKRRNKTLEFYLNYTKDIASIKSRIEATAGYGYYDFWRAAPANYNLNLKGDTLQTNPSDSSQNTLISYYARLNYSYNDLILLTATVRRDGSSRFAPNTRWGTFPSAALAINLIKNSTSLLNNLKLRVGIGETGQRDIGLDYPYIPRYTLSNPQAQYQLGNQFYYTYRPEAFNENLKWESTTTYNGGLDFGFFKGRLSASVDVYKKKTKDLLLFSPLPAGSNLSNQFFLNVGNMENKGVEATISGTPVKTADITWTASFNMTYNENKITNLTQAPDPTNKGIDVGGIAGGVGNLIQKYAVGATANSFYVYKQVYDSSGNLIEGLYADLNRDGQINSDDKYLYKSPYPKFFFGFNSEVDYKEFSLSFVLRANLGNYMYNNVASNSGYYTNIFSSNPFLNNASSDVLTTNFQRPQYWSDYYIQNASFLRMDNLNIGYNFGKIISKNTNLRAGFTVQNVFVITKYKGLDPEIYSGIDNNFYPRPRIYSLGINLDF